jgi:glutamate:Na+ symporter, ESS family
VDWQFGVAATLAIAALVLVIGRSLIERIGFLKEYSIPEPVVGGLVAALLIAVSHGGGVRITFDTSLQPGLMLAFFASIGVGAAWAMGIDPLIGLIAGSVTMSGGHGTGAAWGQKFAESFGLAAAPGMQRTFGLMMGGLVGGPVAHRLIERLKARGAPLGVAKAEVLTHDGAESGGAFTPQRLSVTILLIAACLALGTALSRWAMGGRSATCAVSLSCFARSWICSRRRWWRSTAASSRR